MKNQVSGYDSVVTGRLLPRLRWWLLSPSSVLCRKFHRNVGKSTTVDMVPYPRNADSSFTFLFTTARHWFLSNPEHTLLVLWQVSKPITHLNPCFTSWLFFRFPQ